MSVHHVRAGAWGGQGGCRPEPLELESQMFVSSFVWVLGTQQEQQVLLADEPFLQPHPLLPSHGVCVGGDRMDGRPAPVDLSTTP